ncbi:MAG: hypothetical protein ACUZ8O_09910 [Candidatus Anammoxibacter sp.]
MMGFRTFLKDGIEQDEFSEMHKKCLAELNNRYQPGTLKYIEQSHPDIFKEFQNIENRLDKLWGKDINAFREVLTKYYRQNLKMVKVFKERANET